MDLINFIKEKTFKWYKSCIITIFIVNLKDDHDENFIYCLKSYIIKFLWNFVKKKIVNFSESSIDKKNNLKNEENCHSNS